MAEKLEPEDVKWLMERQFESYLVWLGLWLVCLLGNASILAAVVPNDSLPVAKLGVIFALYWFLFAGMVFSVYRVGNISRDHIGLAGQIENKALRDYIFLNRGKISRLVVDDKGGIRKLNLGCIYVLHFVVFFSLFYFTLV